MTGEDARIATEDEWTADWSPDGGAAHIRRVLLHALRRLRGASRRDRCRRGRAGHWSSTRARRRPPHPPRLVPRRPLHRPCRHARRAGRAATPVARPDPRRRERSAGGCPGGHLAAAAQLPLRSPRAVWAPDSRGIAFTSRDDPRGINGTGTHPVVIDLDTDGLPVGDAIELAPLGSLNEASMVWGRPPDETPPVTTPEVSPAANAAGWHRDDVTVRLDAADTGAGVASITHTTQQARRSSARATVDGDNASVVLKDDGVHTIRYSRPTRAATPSRSAASSSASTGRRPRSRSPRPAGA